MIKKLNLALIFLMCFLLCSVCVSAADSIIAGDFNYTDTSLAVSGTIGSGGVKTGALYVVAKGDNIDALSDSNLPLYTDTISTDANGKFSVSLMFSKDNVIFPYGDYDIYIYSRDLISPLTTSFTYHSPEYFRLQKEAEILNDVQNSTTRHGLKLVILGEDIDGNVINDNLALINPDMSDYNQLKDKDAFYTALYSAKANIKTFADIATEFKRVAGERKIAENSDTTVPDDTQTNTQNGNPVTSAPAGTTSPVMSVSPSGGASSGSGMGGSSGAAGGVQSIVFTDMSDHWALSYAKTLASQGVLNGYQDGSFRPDNPVTRAELAKIIAVAFNISGTTGNSFTDVSDDSWYASYVNSMASAGVINGYDGRFNPDQNVSRQDAALMLHRAMSRTHQIGIGYVFFADETSISEYASQEISALAEIGIITGNAQKMFMPLSNLTRGEAAALISRAADYILAH